MHSHLLLVLRNCLTQQFECLVNFGLIKYRYLFFKNISKHHDRSQSLIKPRLFSNHPRGLPSNYQNLQSLLMFRATLVKNFIQSFHLIRRSLRDLEASFGIQLKVLKLNWFESRLKLQMLLQKLLCSFCLLFNISDQSDLIYIIIICIIN